jgi:hypothetical protein
MLKNSLRICPRIDDLGSTLIQASPLDGPWAEFLLLRPIGFSLLSGLLLHVIELG